MLQSTDSRNFGWIKRYGNPLKLIEKPLFFLLPTQCSVLYSIFKMRKTPINHCVHLDAFYLLKSTNSRNCGQITIYGKPPKIIETLSLCLLPTPCSVLYSILKVRKTPINHCVHLDALYLLKSTNSRKFG